ncbi:uncharacterized protein [Struthio camelus]|uniref:uncharacterized protein n=1 Tax=Struthio camelus TaxID=8801 RepID=UPI0036040045
MCTYPRVKHGVEDPRQESRLLSWEYKDCCAVRKEDIGGVGALHSEARGSDGSRAKRQHTDCRGAGRDWTSDRGGESSSVAQWSMDGGREGLWKGGVQYMDCRRVEGAWKGESQDTEGENYEVCEREGIQYRDCSSGIGEGWYREDRVPGEYREGGRWGREDRSPGKYREGGRQYREDGGPREYRKGRRRYSEDRDPRDYSEDERHYKEGERRYRDERASGEYREEGRRYREDGVHGVHRVEERWKREEGGPGSWGRRWYIDLRDVDQDFGQHRQLKSHIVDCSNLTGSCEAAAFAVCSSGDGSMSLESDVCHAESETRDVGYNGCGEPEGAAPGQAMQARGSCGAERVRLRTGRPDWSPVWEQKATEAGGGGSLLQRNSFYRRTAPSALRHSEFVRTRKEKQGHSAASGAPCLGKYSFASVATLPPRKTHQHLRAYPKVLPQHLAADTLVGEGHLCFFLYVLKAPSIMLSACLPGSSCFPQANRI